MKILNVFLLTSFLATFGSAQEVVPVTTTEEQAAGEAASNPEDSPCPEVWIDFCKREAERYCFIDDQEEKKCGTCLPGLVEWRARCISQDQVDIIVYLEEYAPQYLEPISMLDRAQFLLETIKFIVEHNAKNPPPAYELELNAFSADSEEDVKQRLGFNPNITIASDSELNPMPPLVQNPGAPQAVPEKVDHAELGHVTAVKDQGRCGCCWAVTVAGVIEGAAAVANGYLQSLSHQQLISCDENNFGCNGGNLVYAVGYALKTEFGGVTRLQDYGYSDYDGQTTEQCKISGKVPAVNVQDAEYVVDYYDDYSFDERLDRMKRAVAIQPVAIVIKSNCKTISSYKSGILTNDEKCACTDPLCADHAVLLTGYDDTSSPPSWIIKNSWSAGWGESGFFRIAQTEKGSYGLFGVLLHGVVPTLAFNVTDPVFEPTLAETTSNDSDDGAEWWVWVLVVAGVCAIMCFFAACVCGRKK